ncbi:MAG TPA: DUF2939 domain-containing protein [Desulfomonilaceae bacterium]|nr:DUF2939 domain-containing protein [Desulfomonilaceae bacterium]
MSRKSKIVAVAIIVLLSAVAAGLYSLPYVTLYQIKSAIEQNDAAKLAEYIDFTSVRQNLKDQLKTFLATRMDVIQKGAQILELLGSDVMSRLADTMVDKIVDSIVTPAGLDELMRGKIIFGQLSRGEKKQGTGQTADAGAPPPKIALKYESSTKFVAEIEDRNDAAKKVRLILTRKGLDWKLTAIKLPLDSMPWPDVPKAPPPR